MAKTKFKKDYAKTIRKIMGWGWVYTNSPSFTRTEMIEILNKLNPDKWSTAVAKYAHENWNFTKDGFSLFIPGWIDQKSPDHAPNKANLKLLCSLIRNAHVAEMAPRSDETRLAVGSKVKTNAEPTAKPYINIKNVKKEKSLDSQLMKSLGVQMTVGRVKPFELEIDAVHAAEVAAQPGTTEVYIRFKITEKPEK